MLIKVDDRAFNLKYFVEFQVCRDRNGNIYKVNGYPIAGTARSICEGPCAAKLWDMITAKRRCKHINEPEAATTEEMTSDPQNG